MVSVFQVKPKADKQQKSDIKPTENEPKLYSNIDEEYVLVSGPIYIPKSLLRYSEELEKNRTSRSLTPTYSMLHNQTDGIKHEVSYSSDYTSNESARSTIKESINLDSIPPKVLQLKDDKVFSEISPNQSLLLNQ